MVYLNIGHGSDLKMLYNCDGEFYGRKAGLGKRKKRNLGPRRKRLSRPARLMAARAWLPTYSGQQVVRGYRRWFGVDLPCALCELEMLGVHVKPSYKEAALATYSAQGAKSLKNRQEREERLLPEAWFIEGEEFYGVMPESLEAPSLELWHGDFF